MRAGRDVVVQAPTGAGKTLIFELWSNQGKNRGQAIYTVPTRALANDKLAEWRRRSWNVGIATGDLSENLSAPVIVATLETQKSRLVNGEGPALLVVDEYQMIGDPDRGLNYELALALAPPQTQLLLLSGSVNQSAKCRAMAQSASDEKPQLIRHELRPVSLEEVHREQSQIFTSRRKFGATGRVLAARRSRRIWGPFLFSPRAARPPDRWPQNWRECCRH